MDKEILIQSIMCEVLERLGHLEKQAEILVIGPMHNIHPTNEVIFTSYDSQNIKGYENILITHLSLASLGALAIGSATCESDEMILTALLEDQNVYLLEDALAYRNYKKKSYNPLYAHYMQCENKLRQLGIKIIKSSYELFKKEVVAVQQVVPIEKIEDQVECVSITTPAIDLTHMKLLRESDLMRVQPMTTITIKKNCIITPLAQDRIQAYQLKIKRI